MNIYQRLNEVRKAVPYIQKDKQVKGQGYMAVTHDAVTAALREHLIAHGIIIVPTLVESSVKDTGTTTSSGVPIIRFEARFDVSFVNMDDPEDWVVLRMESHALDQGDKAPGKATSYATKYAMLKLFSIETGEEEEERLPAKGGNKILTGTITPTTDAWAGVAPARVEYITRLSEEAQQHAEAKDVDKVYEVFYGNIDQKKIDNDEAVALWASLGKYSGVRNKVKKLREERKQLETA